MPGEFDLIERFFRRAQVPAATAGDGALVALGIGDDAALLTPAAGMQLAVSTDTLIEGVHFPVDTPAAAVGWKALAVNLSDLAAMGASPRAALLALSLPRRDDVWLTGFARGFFALADQHACVLAGGDTTAMPAHGPVTITVTVFGEVPAGAALLRSGARPGDLVCVSGAPGVAALGLARWQAGQRDQHDAAIAALLRPQPRLTLGVALRGIASACIDVSDGLLGDLGHVLASSGCGAELDLAALPRAPALAALSEEAASEYILGGGDDYELCCTVAPEHHDRLLAAAAATGTAVTVIGRVVTAPGVRCLDSRGQVWQPQRRSWEHFA